MLAIFRYLDRSRTLAEGFVEAHALSGEQAHQLECLIATAMRDAATTAAYDIAAKIEAEPAINALPFAALARQWCETEQEF